MFNEVNFDGITNWERKLQYIFKEAKQIIVETIHEFIQTNRLTTSRVVGCCQKFSRVRSEHGLCNIIIDYNGMIIQL